MSHVAKLYGETLMLNDDEEAHKAAEAEMRAAMFAEARRRMEVLEQSGEILEDNVIKHLVEQCAEDVRRIVSAAEEKWKRRVDEKVECDGEKARLDFEERERRWAEEEALRRASWEESDKREAQRREAERKHRLHEREADVLKREERAARTHKLRHDIYDRLHRQKYEKETSSPKSFSFEIPESPKSRSRFS